MQVEFAEPWARIASLTESEVLTAWSSSGAQWLSGPGNLVPSRLVRRAVGMIEYLDDAGARLLPASPTMGLELLSVHAALTGLQPCNGRASCNGRTHLLRTADSWIALGMHRPDDRDVVPAWLETDLADTDDIWEHVEGRIRSRSSEWLTQRAGLLGLPCATLGETTDRREVILERLGDADRIPLDGLIVANLGSLWAAPLTGNLLARLGARVIKVESWSRPDGARSQPTFFAALNAPCESVALDLRTSRGQGQLQRLLDRVDVVIDGSRPRALAQMGVDVAGLARSGPRIWVSITGYGRSDPHSGRVGLGDDTAAAGGLVEWSSDGEPRFIGDAIADPLAGLTAATAVAALAAAGGRWLVDVALARVAAAAAARPDDPALVASQRAATPWEGGGPLAPAPALGSHTAEVLQGLGIAE